jgi:hypothetical protein
MKRTSVQTRAWPEQARSWVVDYSAARAQAIRWLGDRYLLAKPINASDSSVRRTARR